MTLMLVSAAAMAVPAKRVKKTITLNDGSRVEVTLRGDEYAHYLQAQDGRAFLEDEKGQFQLVDKDELSAVRSQRMQASNVRRTKRKASWGADRNPVSGSKKGLVILVNFSDKKFNAAYTQQFYNRYFNEVGFSERGMNGSVHDYFYASSYGQFDLTFDVIGPVTVQNTCAYYGKNKSSGDDAHPAELVIEAVNLADQAGVDFTKYDWDNDGHVDQVFVVYAGFGEAQGGASNTIWPHEWDLTSAKYSNDGTGAQKLDGVWVDTYAVSCELCGSSGTKVDGIGTACHEFSHCMCLPDFYDTSGSTTPNYGMDTWDLMDYGCYAGDNYEGTCPTGYTSYERMYCGWLEPKEISGFTEVTSLKSLATNADAYIIYNKKNRNEFYMLENRQLEGWFKYGIGHGMLVLHVDFSQSAWSEGTVNNVASHQRMTIIPADNSFRTDTESDYTGDTYPGSKRKTELTNTSTPAATLYNTNTDGKKFMNMPIRNIKESNKVISFVAGDRVIDAPVANEPTDLTENSFVASWNAIEGITTYQVIYSGEKIQNYGGIAKEIFVEDFSGFNNGTTSVGTSDISAVLDKYTKTTGWTGTKLFTSSNDEVKLGSSSAVGVLTTPMIQAPMSGNLTIALGKRQYNGTDNAKMEVLISYGDEETMVQDNIELTSEESTQVINLTGINKPFMLTVRTSAKRGFITNLSLYDGTYTADQLNTSTGESSSAQTITVTGTSCKIGGLDYTCVYTYKVRAIDGEYSSDWSNLVEVRLPAPVTPEDAIQSVGETQPTGAIYDLSGRRLQQAPAKGFYIQNGKKVLR